MMSFNCSFRNKNDPKAIYPPSGYQMNGLEEQADNVQANDLYWKPLSWLRTIRPTSSNDAFDPAVWTIFVSTMLGLEVLSPPPP